MSWQMLSRVVHGWCEAEEQHSARGRGEAANWDRAEEEQLVSRRQDFVAGFWQRREALLESEVRKLYDLHLEADMSDPTAVHSLVAAFERLPLEWPDVGYVCAQDP